MKKLLLGVIAVAALASCSKENVNPVKPTQKVTYTVKCGACAVYYEDNNFNRTDTVAAWQKKVTTINGEWSYTFENYGLKVVALEVYTSVFAPTQRIKATITTNDSKSVVMDRDFSIDNNQGKIELILK